MAYKYGTWRFWIRIGYGVLSALHMSGRIDQLSKLNFKGQNMEQVHQGHNSVLAKLTYILQLCLESASGDDSLPNSILEAISQVTKLAQQCRIAHAEHEAMETRLYKSLTTMKKGYELQKGEIASLTATMGVERVSKSTNTDPAHCTMCLSKDSLLQQHSTLMSQQQVRILELEQQLKKSRFLMQAQQVLLDERQKKVSSSPSTVKDGTRHWDSLFDDSIKRQGDFGGAALPGHAIIKPPLPNRHIPDRECDLLSTRSTREAEYVDTAPVPTEIAQPRGIDTEARNRNTRGRAVLTDSRGSASHRKHLDENADVDDELDVHEHYVRGARHRYQRGAEDPDCAAHGDHPDGEDEGDGEREEEEEEAVYRDEVNFSLDSIRSSVRSAERSSADSATTASSASAASAQSMHSLDSCGSLQYDSSGDMGDDPDQYIGPAEESTGGSCTSSEAQNRYGWLPPRYSGAGKGEQHTTQQMNWADTVATQSVDLNDSFALIQMCYSVGGDDIN